MVGIREESCGRRSRFPPPNIPSVSTITIFYFLVFPKCSGDSSWIECEDPWSQVPHTGILVSERQSFLSGRLRFPAPKILLSVTVGRTFVSFPPIIEHGKRGFPFFFFLLTVQRLIRDNLESLQSQSVSWFDITGTHSGPTSDVETWHFFNGFRRRRSPRTSSMSPHAIPFGLGRVNIIVHHKWTHRHTHVKSDYILKEETRSVTPSMIQMQPHTFQKSRVFRIFEYVDNLCPDT